MNKGLIYLLLLLFSSSLYSETVRISIFNDHSFSSFVISSDKGQYLLVADNKMQIIMWEDEPLYVSMIAGRLLLGTKAGIMGIFSTVSFTALEDANEFSIRIAHYSVDRAYYHGSLEIGVNFDRISLINDVNEEIYLAGVVEAESGTGSHHMYYKAQAIICRTYLHGNLHRHEDEGFHLCDAVHCQVYKGRLTSNEVIYEAVNATSGKVITYGDSGLIIAAFHSNCGGQTANSEDVWLIHKHYLRSVKDPYCRKRRNSLWRMKVDAGKWESYLAGMGFDNSSRQVGFHKFAFKQYDRKIFYRINGFNIPFIKLRSDWDLKSAFFDIEVPNPGRELLISGRGYGHGVGLCQEGAMEMAVRGYTFMEILQFYYTDITIIP